MSQVDMSENSLQSTKPTINSITNLLQTTAGASL